MLINENTTSLRNLLAAVNALPEAGGGSVETCTVTVTNNLLSESTWGVELETVDAYGMIVDTTGIKIKGYFGCGRSIDVNGYTAVCENVVKDSWLLIAAGGIYTKSIIADGEAEYLGNVSMMGDVVAFHIMGDCTITLEQ